MTKSSQTTCNRVVHYTHCYTVCYCYVLWNQNIFFILAETNLGPQKMICITSWRIYSPSELWQLRSNSVGKFHAKQCIVSSYLRWVSSVIWDLCSSCSLVFIVNLEQLYIQLSYWLEVILTKLMTMTSIAHLVRVQALENQICRFDSFFPNSPMNASPL